MRHTLPYGTHIRIACIALDNYYGLSDYRWEKVSQEILSKHTIKPFEIRRITRKYGVAFDNLLGIIRSRAQR